MLTEMALMCVCRFVDEMVTAGVLRLFEVFLGDGPTLTLLVRDDVWGRSEDWRQQIMGECAVQLNYFSPGWFNFSMLFSLVPYLAFTCYCISLQSHRKPYRMVVIK